MCVNEKYTEKFLLTYLGKFNPFPHKAIQMLWNRNAIQAFFFISHRPISLSLATINKKLVIYVFPEAILHEVKALNNLNDKNYE